MVFADDPDSVLGRWLLKKGLAEAVSLREGELCAASQFTHQPSDDFFDLDVTQLTSLQTFKEKNLKEWSKDARFI